MKFPPPVTFLRASFSFAISFFAGFPCSILFIIDLYEAFFFLDFFFVAEGGSIDGEVVFSVLETHSDFGPLSASTDFIVSIFAETIGFDSADAVGTALARDGVFFPVAGLFLRQHVEHMPPVALLPKKPHPDAQSVGEEIFLGTVWEWSVMMKNEMCVRD